jgi:hypothetical protein
MDGLLAIDVVSAANIIIIAVVIVLVIYVIYRIVTVDASTRERISALMDGNLGQNGDEIKRNLRKLRKKTAADHIAAAKVARATLTGVDRVAVPAAMFQEALTVGTAGDVDALATRMTLDAIAAENWYEDELFFNDVAALIGELGETTGKVAATDAGTRIERAREQTDNAADAAAVAIADARNYTGDAQNSHDTAAGHGLRQILDGIRTSSLASPNEIRDYVAEYAKSHPAATGARAVVDKMLEAGPITTYDSDERTILLRVWGRSNHPNNSKNSANIKDAIVDALADANKDNHMVCANGRAARVIGALAGTDFDPNFAAVGTVSMWRNQLLSEVKDIVAESDKSYDAPDVEKGARIYHGDSGEEPTDAVMAPFLAVLRGKIDKKADKYRDKLPNLDVVRAEAYTYAGI